LVVVVHRPATHEPEMPVGEGNMNAGFSGEAICFCSPPPRAPDRPRVDDDVGFRRAVVPPKILPHAVRMLCRQLRRELGSRVS